MATKTKKTPKKHQLWFKAIENGDLKIAEEMLSGSKKLPVDTEREDGRTALILAAGNSDHHMVKLLLDSGSSVNFKNRMGKSALSATIAPDWGFQHTQAKEGSWEETVKLLLKRGAKPDQNTLYHLIQAWEPEEVAWFLENCKSTIPMDLISKTISAAKSDHHERHIDEASFKENIRILLSSS